MTDRKIPSPQHVADPETDILDEAAKMHEIPDLKIIPGLSPDDPFAPHNVQLKPDDVVVGVKAIVHLPVKKPRGMGFFRVHPSITIDTVLLEHDRELFYVAPGMRAYTEEGKPHTLFFCLNRTGSPFLWPVRLPDETGKSNQWWESARETAELGKTKWVRCWANLRDNTYDVVMATAPIPDPKWPDLDIAGIMRLAFKTRLIDTPDHDVLKALRGEV